jgi:O-antigen/teichoic acid export membrane protein
VFVTLRTIANVIRQAINALLYALSPEIASLDAHGKFESLQTLHVFTTKILLVTSICAAAFLHFMGADLVRLWTRGQIEYDGSLMNAFLLLLLSQAYWLTSSYILGATNNHRTVAVCTIASGAAGLGLGVVLAHWFGLAGLAYGLSVADVIICGWVLPAAACRLIRANCGDYMSDTLGRSVAFMVVVYACTYAVVRFLPTGDSMTRIVLTGSAVAALGIVFSYLIALCRPERRRVLAVATSYFTQAPAVATGQTEVAP